MEQIIKEMELEEIFHFSLLSKRCETAVELANVQVYQIEWRLNEHERVIRVNDDGVNTRDRKGRKPFWISFTAEQQKTNQLGPVSQQFNTRSHCLGEPNVLTSKPTENLLEHLSALVLKIFKTDNLIFESRDVLPPIFWHKWNLQFKRFKYDNSEDSEDVVSHEDYKFLLDNVNSEELDIDVRVAPGFQYFEPLKHKTIFLDQCDWVTRDNLLNMECKWLRIEHSNITTEDLNVFFDKWKQGGFPQLKWLFFSRPEEVQWDLRFEQMDEDGKPFITDVHGNRGTFKNHLNHFIWFEVDVVV